MKSKNKIDSDTFIIYIKTRNFQQNIMMLKKGLTLLIIKLIDHYQLLRTKKFLV